VASAHPRSVATVDDLPAAARNAVAAPISGPPLRELARGAQRVAIAITDATRPSPDSVLLPALWEELQAAGVTADRVRIIIGLGMHRVTTPEEKAARLGPLQGRFAVIDAQGGVADDYVSYDDLDPRLYSLPTAVPVRVHRAVAEADLVIATGVVEPHQYAGFSGGRKGVAIGCAGEATIAVLHGRHFLDHPGTRLGRIDGNPVHTALEAIARAAGLRFVLNVALDARGGVIAVAAGEPGPAHAHLVHRLEEVIWTPTGEGLFDAVLAGVAAPKDVNLYQASRAITYLAFSPEPVVREGGWLGIAARCPEGVGQGKGEEAFHQRMRAGDSPTDVMRDLRENGFGAGGQRAYVLASALETYRGLVICAESPAMARECHLTPVADGAETVALLRKELGADARVLLVPHGMTTLPLRRRI